MQLKQIVLLLLSNLFSEILLNKKVIPIFLRHHHWRHRYCTWQIVAGAQQEAPSKLTAFLVQRLNFKLPSLILGSHIGESERGRSGVYVLVPAEKKVKCGQQQPAAGPSVDNNG
jgi:hypothetical protein